VIFTALTVPIGPTAIYNTHKQKYTTNTVTLPTNPYTVESTPKCSPITEPKKANRTVWDRIYFNKLHRPVARDL